MVPVEHASSAAERLRAASADLIAWFRANKRPLPWRDPVDPYHTWISEIMLQQTRIDVVIDYYHRFLIQFPDIRTLSEASEDSLLKMWEGLGYYNRVRNIGRAAGIIMEEYGGQFPRTKKELAKLPGIGDYTAAAIASIDFGEPAPAVDGNVLRVCARLLDDDRDVLLPATRKAVTALLEQVIPADAPGDFNEAVMELGETICLPESQTDCSRCPVRAHCLAYAHQTADRLPVRNARTAKALEKLTVFIITAPSGSSSGTAAAPSGTRIAIRKRPSTGLLSGLFEFPNAAGYFPRKKALEWLRSLGLDTSADNLVSIDKLPDLSHVFSHKKWLMKGWRIALRSASDAEASSLVWAAPDELESTYSIPGAFAKFKPYI